MPVGSDDGHVGLDAVVRALVEVEDARLLAAAGADHLCGNRAVDVLFFEGQQCLDPPRHAGVFADPRVVDLHAIELSFELAVLPANPAQVGIVCKQILYPLLAVNDSLFDRSNGGDGPQADETGFAFLRRPAYLHRQPNNLGEQDGRQHDQVLIAAEECVHTIADADGPGLKPRICRYPTRR